MASTPHIEIARIRDKGKTKGARLLVDRLWPRGIKKEDLPHSDWIKDVAPSDELRKWFGHDADKWKEFRRRYRAELDKNDEAVEQCLSWCRKGPVTLLFDAKDEEHNQAVVLQEYLTERLQSGDKKQD